MNDGINILVARHGEQVRDGQNGPLTERGSQQAKALGDTIGLSEDDRLVCSSLRRAVQTARALGREPEQVADLDEFRFDDSWTWAQADDNEDLALWKPEHHGGDETLAQFQTRVERAVDGLVRTAPAGRLVLVVHAGVIDAILRWAFGTAADQPWVTEADAAHTAVAELTHWTDGRHEHGAPRHTVLHRLGDIGHLPPELVTEH